MKHNIIKEGTHISRYQQKLQELKDHPKTWLITGCAGFIGSNLLELLLSHRQNVIGVDDFSTGFIHNLDDVKHEVGDTNWRRFHFVEGSICNKPLLDKCLNGVDYVLHQAALGSVPRSIANPLATNEANITGFLTMLTAAKDAKVKSFTYAASSSTYGDHPALPKLEQNIGRPLSPYAVTKLVNELYANVFHSVYGFNSIGLRYFNVFGKRQNIRGAYAAVIPKWITQLQQNQPITINGDGETSRDFCYIDNAMQMNILAATSDNAAQNKVYNVALGDRTSLLTLFELICDELKQLNVTFDGKPIFADFRAGDVRHSQADIEKAKSLLGYCPRFRIGEGIKETVRWFVKTGLA